MKKIALIVPPLFVVATEQTEESTTVNKRYMCATELDGSGSFFSFSENLYPKNREHLLDHCEEHAGNTCC